ncbi:T9SS type A sorting domain-containing protein [Flavobacterium sp. D11R37]|uniref:Ig-like domain-containing protein n=1 Tax=Flavobacterium coralii TaxID=2838017 RepID=UPI001CA78A29|nr:GEVED domain-containing protein [Flavobacterium coralii]MBY8963551.1 T9SS type A sorting domain-containing protein [Flavobacterium coralii]
MKLNLRLLFYSFTIFAALSLSGYAQINYSESFDDDTHNWDLYDFYEAEGISCEGAGSLYANLYDGWFFGYFAEMTSPALGTSLGTEVTLTYQYKLLEYDDENPTVPVQNADDWGYFEVYYATSPTGPFTLIETIDPDNHIESADCATRTATFTPPAGVELYIYVVAELGDLSNDFLFFFDEITVVEEPLEACTGTPAVVATLASTAFSCEEGDVTLSLPFATASGLEYQWQTSANGTDFTDVATGGEDDTYVTTQTATTWYRAVITCTASGQSVNSTPVQVVASGLPCYCDIEFWSIVEPITNVEFAGIDNASSPETDASPSLENFTNVAPAQVNAGGTYDIALEGNTNGDYETFFTVFIDFNHNGEFEFIGEAFEIGSIENSDGEDGQEATGEIYIPLDAMQGLTMMRIVKNYDEYTIDSCGEENGWGQAEDYLVNILPPVQLDYVNLQWPPTMELSVGETGTVYAQAYEDGVTPGAGPGAGVTAWIGISEEDTDPSTWDTWIPATYNTAVTGNNDEFMVDIGAGLEPGTYYYASRFQLQEGPYTYGGYTPTGGGYWDGTTNVSGVLTVTCDTEAPTAVAEQQFCAGATVAGLSADGDTIVWYTTETGGEPLEEETVLENGTYYAAQIPEGGCESQSRTAVTITVVTIDTPNVTVIQPTCAVNSGSITIDTPSGDGLVYSINGADFQASNVFSELEGGTYMVYVENELGCISEPFTVVLEPAEGVEAPVADAQQTVCNGSALEELMAEGDNVVWYADETGGEPLDIETMLTDGTTYYAASVDGECESERTAVTVTLNVVPAPTGETIQEFDGPATLTFEDIDITAEGELTWYASEEDALNSDNDLDNDYEITETQTLYVTQEIDGCESAPFAVTVEVVLSTESFDSAAFRYHPNPVKDVLTLTYSSAIENVVVYNLLGQSVIERSGSSNEMQLDMAQLSAGTYIVKVTSQGAVKTLKVVKQ